MINKIINAHLQRGEFNKALKILENVIKNGNQNIFIFFWLGKIHFELNNFIPNYFVSCLILKKALV